MNAWFYCLNHNVQMNKNMYMLSQAKRNNPKQVLLKMDFIQIITLHFLGAIEIIGTLWFSRYCVSQCLSYIKEFKDYKMSLKFYLKYIAELVQKEIICQHEW